MATPPTKHCYDCSSNDKSSSAQSISSNIIVKFKDQQRFRSWKPLCATKKRTIMRIFVPVSTFFIFVFLLGCSSSSEPYDEIIHFHFTHSMRIPYHSIDIKLLDNGDNQKVHLISKPYEKDTKWEYSRLDETYSITHSQFDCIIKTIESIDDSNVEFQEMKMGLDGSTWRLHYFKEDTTKHYEIWSADYETDKRSLNKFVEVSELLVKASKLDAKEILDI